MQLSPAHPADPIDPCLDRALAGEATAQDRLQLQRWAATIGAPPSVVEALFASGPNDDVVAQSSRGRSDGWDAIVRALETDNVHPNVRPSSPAGLDRQRTGVIATRLQTPRLTMAMRAAIVCAAVSLVTMGALAVYARFSLSARDTDANLHTYATKAGQRATITLPDGSRMWLRPATTVTVATAVNHSEQGMTITVDGEARFTVAANRKIPFVVHAGRATARVLGTTFLIRRYSTDRETRVVVQDGRVALLSAHGTAVLATRMLGVATDSGRVTVISNIALDDYPTWNPDQLVFQKTPVSDVVAELRREFNADIRLGDSTLAHRTLTGTIPIAKQSLNEVLDLVSASLNTHLVRSGQVITILPGPATVRRSIHEHSSFSVEPSYGR